VSSPVDNGLFSQDFMTRYLGSDFLFRHKLFAAPDSTVGWSYSRPATFHSTLFNDTYTLASSGSGVRVFGVRDTNDVVLWATPGTLDSTQIHVAPIAVKSAVGAGGEVVVASLPALAIGGPSGGGRFIDKVFALLGIKP
jgi:hypothetical protein